MFALLFDLHGTGARWEVDTIANQQDCVAVIRDSQKKGTPARYFQIVPADGLSRNQILTKRQVARLL